MNDKSLLREAELCRQRALAHLGRPEVTFLLKMAREFERLASQTRTGMRSPGSRLF